MRSILYGWVKAAVAASLVLWHLVWPAGDVLKFSQQSIDRTAAIHRPVSTRGHPAPLMIALHGRGGTGLSFERLVGFDAVADREGFVVVYPDAIAGRWRYGSPNADRLRKIGEQTVDDVGFIRLIMDDLVGKKIADPSRIYVSGASRGGLMTYTIACALSDRVAAIAPMISGMTDHQVEDCHPSRPPAIMLIAGTSDPVQVYDGRTYAADRLLSVAETMEYWRVVDGCTGQEAGQAVPHLHSSDQTKVTVIQWTNCRPNTDVRLYKVIGGGHRIPSLTLATNANPIMEQRFGLRNHDMESAEVIWSFVKRFSLKAS